MLLRKRDIYHNDNPYQSNPVEKLGALLLSLFLLLTVASSSAQNITETQWYFGNSIHNLQFDKNGEIVYPEENQLVPFGIGGPAVISDQFTGNLLFYSDGSQVIDGSHQVVPNGIGLSGNPSINQSAIACPFPNSGSRYILFTNSGANAPNEIQFSLLDASIQGNSTVSQIPFGDLVTPNQSTGLTDPAEAMIVIEVGDNESYWLISQNRTTFDFRVTAINPTGIDSTRVFDLTSTQFPDAEAAHFAFNSDSSLLAVAPKTANRNVSLLNFNRFTGDLTFNRPILNTGFDDGQGESVYDVEWSPDGSKIYVSRFGGPALEGALYQFDFNDTLQNVNPIFSSLFRSLGLKRGLDDNVYHLYQETSTGPFLLGRINEPDSTFDLVQYESMVYDSDFVANQFPAFAPPNLIQFDSISFDYRDSCENSTTKLYPFVDPVPHNYLWLVDGSPVSDAVAPVLTLDPGGYQVTLAVERNGTQTQVTRFVEVFTAGFEVNLGNDTTICVDEILTLDAGSDGVSFVWNTGETTQTIDVDTTGTYWVEVTGATGCTVFDDIVVTEYGIQQQIGNQWYFGEMAGIDFNSTPPQPITDANLMSSPEGCASISDVNGQLLFYTNGMTVWNRDHEVMENGNLIGGDSTAAQSAMILPFPDDQTMFYVFTSEEVYGDFTYDLKYSIVDIKEDTAMGRVTIKGMTLFNNSTERVTASAFGVPSNLITHEFGNNSFRTNLISDQGIASTLYSPVGEVHNFLSEPNATGYMKFAPGLQNFATLVPGSNLIEIFDVVDTTGRLVNPRTIDSQEPTSTNLYGLEFSTDALKLYVTTTGGSSKLIQYDLDSLGSTNAEAEIEATKFDGYGAGSNFGALQRGPNGIIYMAVDNATSIGTINSPNGDDAGASFNASGFDLAGRVSRLGLPNFTQQVGAATQQPGLAFELACFGQPIQFTGSGTSDIDEYEWDFGPDAIPETSTDQTVDVIFLNDSTYDVTLRIFNRCGFDSLFTQSVEVFGIPEQPQVPDNPALCGDSLILTAWPEDRDDLNYYWSTGETTRSITVFEPAIIDVAIINTDGCSSDTLEVFVGTGNPFIDLGPDQTICQFETPPALDSDNANATYDWQIDGVAAGTDRFQNIDTSTPGLFEYTVSVIEPVTGCIGRDTIQITILEAPAVVSAVSQPSSCGANDGSIQFSINNTGTFTYEVAGLSSIPPTTFDGPGSPPGLFNLAPSSYTLVVTNTVTGCVTTEIILVEDVAPFDMSASDIPDCLSDADLRVSLSGTMVPTAVDIYIIDVFGDTIINQPNTSVPPTLINNIPAGTYQVSVQEVGGFGCIQTDTVQVVDEIPADNECLPKIVAPNAFSPNEDELNELFFVFPNPFVDTFQIFVYTRWGELVYFSDDLNFRWDGSFDNKTLPVGTYAYILKFTSNVDPEIGVIEQYGSITLIR